MFDPKRWRRPARSAGVLALSLGMVGACEPVGRTIPPEHDPAAPQASLPPWTPGPNPFATSAFAGENLDQVDAHQHHHHGAGTNNANSSANIDNSGKTKDNSSANRDSSAASAGSAASDGAKERP